MKDESATSSEPSRRPSTSDSSATTAASGKTGRAGRTGKKRGKMYWKFATLEGWRAEDHQTQNANQPADGAERAERMEKTTDTPGD
jgi:hypothetical protein